MSILHHVSSPPPPLGLLIIDSPFLSLVKRQLRALLRLLMDLRLHLARSLDQGRVANAQPTLLYATEIHPSVSDYIHVKSDPECHLFIPVFEQRLHAEESSLRGFHPRDLHRHLHDRADRHHSSRHQSHVFDHH